MEKIDIKENTPLVGCIQFGIIDRGSNLIQIRPTSLCNLNCKFCSTDAGVQSKAHNAYFEVKLEHLLNWVKKAIELKGEILANLDSVGEIFSYPEIYELLKKLKSTKGVKEVSMQTNGVLIDFEKCRHYVDRINLSINSLNPEKAKDLAGCSYYDVEKVKNLARNISKSNVELLLAPVWMPGLNDKDIVEIIKFAKELKCKIGIQNYEVYKYSRKIFGAERINYFKFYKQLDKWEKEFDIKLKLGPRDFEIKKAKRFPIMLEIGDRISAEIVCQGWNKEQMIAKAKDRCITINNCSKRVGDRVNVKVLENKNNIYLAEVI